MNQYRTAGSPKRKAAAGVVEDIDGSISVTMDVYTHLDLEQIQEKMDAVQSKMI